MATFKTLYPEVVREKGLLIHLKCRPEQVCQYLLNGNDSDYIVRSATAKSFCRNCNHLTRASASNCWYCCQKLLEVGQVKALSVKLATNRIPSRGVHGLLTTILESWNPSRLIFFIRRFGNGTEIKVECSGLLSIYEFIFFSLLCSILSIALYIGSGIHGDYFHCAVAVFLLILGPPVFVKSRQKQEQKLFEFLNTIESTANSGAIHWQH